ncbi:MAG TPA: disulfide bond formation protein DsbA, partial [Sphingopyxis terrae]|nr:disulfide bond formation protein DsbA [Sphingopyxis terrae]
MTDKKDEYYQPWLRDPSPALEPLPRADEGLAKPKDAPPVGIDVGRYTPKPAPARDPRVSGAQLKA